MRVDRVLAPNPGPFTGPGTNTYVVGDDLGVAVIDPGPIDSSHARSIVQTIGERRPTAVIVTHTHPDHAPLANPLARELGVPALGFAPGPGFDPDDRLADGSVVTAGSVELVSVHTPGHADDHLCFRSDDVLFTGDHIMGGSSVLVDEVSPYMASLERLLSLELSRLYPGHGPEMGRPREVISWYLAHRRQRELQILSAVRSGGETVGAVVELVYADVDPGLHGMAARNVAAHLRKLANEGLVRYAGTADWSEPVEVLM